MHGEHHGEHHGEPSSNKTGANSPRELMKHKEFKSQEVYKPSNVDQDFRKKKAVGSEVTALLHTSGDQGLPGKASEDIAVPRVFAPPRGHGQGAAPVPRAPVTLGRCGAEPPAGPAARGGSGLGTGAVRPPVRDLLPSHTGPAAREDAAATPRHLRASRALPAPQPGHGDSVPHCGTSALPQPGGAPGNLAGPSPALPVLRSPSGARSCRYPPALTCRRSLGCSRSRSRSAALTRLQRPHRPPGGPRAARRVM
ncbi:brain acid soluble protein 1-like [Neopelma chrysocephalum]|uniref:brain acid soluble protein 1-like n=1 Tax=Neopelma chrysocephalum TaxID=114329 RepID=UPI000FCD31A3|nr:brain acid soluble protein 1-like [Neopelma chrysocephalum]